MAPVPAPAPRVTVSPQPGLDDEPMLPSEGASDQALRLIGQARRLADDGRFAEARARLDQAEGLVPGLGQTAETRRKITELSTPQGQLATQLGRARSAIDNDDNAAAEKALIAAERLDPKAPAVAVLRQAFLAAQQKEAARHAHIVELLAAMRAAIARHDIAAADGALNEASRLDLLDPLIDRARTELAHAHDEARKRELGR